MHAFERSSPPAHPCLRLWFLHLTFGTKFPPHRNLDFLELLSVPEILALLQKFGFFISTLPNLMRLSSQDHLSTVACLDLFFKTF